MEFPVSRFHCESLDQVHACKIFADFPVPRSSIFAGGRFLISKRKLRSPFAQMRVLRPKLKPKPKPNPKPMKPHMDVEIKTQREQNLMRKQVSGFCEQIENLVMCKRYQEALERFEIMEYEGGHELEASTYDAIVRACIDRKSVRGVKKMLNHMNRRRFKLDQYMSNKVLLALVKCGMMIDARRLFDEMPERTTATWNMMISGLVDWGDCFEAFNLFLNTWSESSDADAITLSTVMRACAGLGTPEPGMQLHACIIKLGEPDNIYVSCALIDMYSKSGRMDDARFLFDEMPQKTTVGWNTIIAAYALHGYSEEALSLYYEMRDSGAKMDHFTFSIIVRICARLGSLEHAKQAHAALVRQGFTLDVVANTSLVDLYSKWGRIEEARNVFDRMTFKNVISWNALIAGYGNHGQGEEAVKLFYQMTREGVKPNHVTFLAVLSACSYSGLSECGWEIFDSMCRLYKIKPRAMHYACMIELLGREGHLDEALALIRDAPFRPTANMWAALLTASRVYKNVELGKFVAEKLYGMGPEKLSNYIVLLNIYNNSGKLEDAASVVQALRQKGLRMVPASTWIEIKKQSHVFYSGDESHPQTKEIYKRLKVLLLEISNHGYVPEKGGAILPDVDEKEKRLLLCHSEKLAVAFGVMSTPDFTSLQLVQSHRTCNDCHHAVKLISAVTGRVVVLRDASRFHRFKNGSCSCGDYW